MSIILTGYKGFIGQNYYKKYGDKNFILIEKEDVIPTLKQDDIIIHLGATTNTMSGLKECLFNNFLFTIRLFNKCKKIKCKLIYASSASVYGNGFLPLNYYAWSKLLTDIYINNRAVGLRFFNVFGEGEEHKKEMMSIPSKIKKGYNKLFQGTKNHSRDFIYVKDVCDVINYFTKNYILGTYDVGSGKTTKISNLFKTKYETIPLPHNLKNKLQTNTKANLTNLKQAGFNKKYLGVKKWL
jgi:ADP-L-glycero-D-manno-heptose 6-epimerase